MKKFILTLICLAFTLPAFASGDRDEHNERRADAQRNGPCKKIKEACEAAGYTKGGHKDGGKGLHIDCMKKLRDGETVEGVSISAEDLASCKEKAAEHRAKKSKRSEKKKADANTSSAQ